MNEFLFEYYYDPTRKKCCLNCNHYYRHIDKYDIPQLTKVNEVKEPHKLGQKYCIKNKIFVFMSDSCGHFSEIQEWNILPNTWDGYF